MKTILKIALLVIGTVVMLTGCASSDVSPSTRTESITDASPTPKQMTASEVDELQSQSVEASGGYVFYDSYADW